MTTLIDSIEAEFFDLEQDAIHGVEQIAALFSADVWPFVKAGILTLLTVAGKAALNAEVASIPLELSGNVGAAAAGVGAAITSAVATNALAVAETEGQRAAATIASDPNATVAEQNLATEIKSVIPPATNGSDLPHPITGS